MDQGREIRQSKARVNGRRRRQKNGEGTMRLARRRFFHLATGAIAAANYPHSAFALDYPKRPITIVVPFAAGGATDVLAACSPPQWASRSAKPRSWKMSQAPLAVSAFRALPVRWPMV